MDTTVPARDGIAHSPADPDAARGGLGLRDTSGAALAATCMRVALGAMYIAHGPILKAWVIGLGNVAAYFETLGLPGALAYVVCGAEGLGGLLLILGLWPRQVALALSPILIGAIAFAHGANGWLFSAPGGGWEYPAFLLVASAAVVLSRGGALGLHR